jgi:hypothetical protein
VDAVFDEEVFHEAGGGEDAVDHVEALAHEFGPGGGGADEGGEPAFGHEAVLNDDDPGGDSGIREDAEAAGEGSGVGILSEVADAVGGEGAGAGTEGAVGEAELGGGADGVEIGGGAEGGDGVGGAGVDGGGGEAREVEEVGDVGGVGMEPAAEEIAEEGVIVFELDGVGLSGHGFVGVEEADDVYAIVGVGVEALVVGECAGGNGVAGKDGDLVAATEEFLGGVEGEDFGTGGVLREELVDGEEDSHGCTEEERTEIRRHEDTKGPETIKMGSCVLDGNSYQIWGVGTTAGRWS